MHHFHCYIKLAEFLTVNITLSLSTNECGTLTELFTLLVILDYILTKSHDKFKCLPDLMF